MQTELTNSRVQVQIAENQGEADLARARKQAEQMVVTAQAESQRRRCSPAAAKGRRILQVGLSEASVLLRKIGSFGDPRLYALSPVAEHLAQSTQPLVPERDVHRRSERSSGDGRAGTPPRARGCSDS